MRAIISAMALAIGVTAMAPAVINSGTIVPHAVLGVGSAASLTTPPPAS